MGTKGEFSENAAHIGGRALENSLPTVFKDRRTEVDIVSRKRDGKDTIKLLLVLTWVSEGETEKGGDGCRSGG